MNPKNLKAIDALNAIKPSNKAAQIRELLPLIEQRISEGVRYKEIVEALNKADIKISISSFKTYLLQARKASQPLTDSSLNAAHFTAQSPKQETASIQNIETEPTKKSTMQELHETMYPSEEDQLKDIARYEKAAREMRKSK